MGISSSKNNSEFENIQQDLLNEIEKKKHND